MRKWNLLGSFATALLLSGCLTVPNTHPSSVAGKLSHGAIWAETNGPRNGALSLYEVIDLLEPQEERECIPVGHWSRKDPSKWVLDFPVCADNQNEGTRTKLPRRAGAIILSIEDYKKQRDTIEKACRMLGDNCDYEKSIEALERVDVMLLRASKHRRK